MTFVNIFDSDADDQRLNELDEEERKQVIDYCKYRSGIETTLKTQAELEACKAQ
ncbi:hypothetical protein [Pseudomonas sp. v388]|uniref:hypothetical protein n=1 Tax=Pseudomonas sp. v388 TaxID=2479849 RepID=UPI0026D74EAE|nr:hypothetical protein [Pseudomonas sp. v388]